MGKKSTGDFPYLYEERNEAPFSSLSDNVKQLGDYLHWDEMFKQFLRLLEGNENRSAQVLREEVPFSAKSPWEAEDNSSLKDVRTTVKNNLSCAFIGLVNVQHEAAGLC